MSQEELLKIKEQAEMLIELDRDAEAVPVIAKGLSIAPDDYDLLCNMTQALIGLRKWQKGYEYAKKAVSANPEDSWAHRLISIILQNGGRRYDAVKSAEEAVRLEPYQPVNWYVLADAQLHVFKLKEARESAEKLREIAPDWNVTHQILARIALKAENYKEAEEHCRRELELAPNSYAGLNNMGVALQNQNRKREAIEYFNRAAKLNPAEETAKDNLESAITNYIPQIGIGFGAIWIVFQVLRLVGRQSQIIAVIVLGSIACAIIGFFVFKQWRYSQLPKEAKNYMDFLKKQSLPSHTDNLKKDWKRTVLIVVCAISAFITLFWSAIFFIDSKLLFFSYLNILILIISLFVFGGSLLFLVLRKSKEED